MKTLEERTREAIANHDFSNGQESIDALIAYAYYLGKCEATKEVSDKYADLLAEQHKKADECRYHRMANEIVGDKDYIYTGDYDQWVKEFSNDTTEL